MNERVSVSWVLGSFLGFFSLFVLSNSDVLVFVLSYYIIIYYYPLKYVCFLMSDKKRLDLDGRTDVKNLGRVEGGEIIIRIYYVRKNIFN